MRIFISYSNVDKKFVNELAQKLKIYGVSVWYDDWEIKVGDSIVDKVYAGLEKSDALVIVLSNESVKSKWVKEELNTAIIKKIQDNNIIILPVLKEECEIPISLKQLKYADFRSDVNIGFMELLDAIEPLRTLWNYLKLIKEHHSLVINQIKNVDLDDLIIEQVEKLHELMSNAVDVRCQIELRQEKEKAKHLDFFQQIGVLTEKGLDVRSNTWNSLVHFRALIAHRSNNDWGYASMLALEFKERYDKSDDRENLNLALDRLIELMKMICEESIQKHNYE